MTGRGGYSARAAVALGWPMDSAADLRFRYGSSPSVLAAPLRDPFGGLGCQPGAVTR
jgi:hypothetical protein